MRRIGVWVSSTVTVVVLLFGYHTSTQGVVATATTQQPVGTGTDASTSGTTISSSGQTVTGDVVQTQWGPVQVQVTTSGGQITAVEVLQYPSGNGRDVEINNYALPVLVDETMSAQSASIDVVSGATVTSDGYLGSLQSALDRAGL